MAKGPYVEGPAVNCLEDEAWASIWETAKVAESVEELVYADVYLVCYKKRADHLIFVDEPEKRGDDEDIAGQKVSAA